MACFVSFWLLIDGFVRDLIASAKYIYPQKIKLGLYTWAGYG